MDLALPKAAPAQPAKQQFKALYDYDAVEVDELTFREGDVISLTKKVCGGGVVYRGLICCRLIQSGGKDN